MTKVNESVVFVANSLFIKDTLQKLRWAQLLTKV